MGQWFESLSAHSHDPGERGKGPETGQRPPTAPTHPGAAIAARKRALTEWDRANPDTVYDPELFRREILPGLRTVPLTEIMEAAGCSKASASDYRRGKRTPHVSTWAALAELVGERPDHCPTSTTMESASARLNRRGTHVVDLSLS